MKRYPIDAASVEPSCDAMPQLMGCSCDVVADRDDGIAIFATNSAWLNRNVEVTGDVVVNDRDECTEADENVVPCPYVTLGWLAECRTGRLGDRGCDRIFGSSMRSILAFPQGIEPTIHPPAVVDVVASSFIPTPRTIFREVTKLPSGHLLRYRDGRVALSRYWDVDFLQQRAASESSLASILRETFSDAVSSRLSLDLPSSRVPAPGPGDSATE